MLFSDRVKSGFYGVHCKIVLSGEAAGRDMVIMLKRSFFPKFSLSINEAQLLHHPARFALNQLNKLFGQFD